MASVKLTKNEQKKQKDQLKQFQRYLPTLQLKKQQLQMVIRQIESEVSILQKEQKEAVSALQSWVAVYNENREFPKESSNSTVIGSKYGLESVSGVATKFRVISFCSFGPIESMKN